MHFSVMEGTLWKWTNYFSGWQPRWFVLNDGILSYYRSEDDVNNGCKGSIKMSVCDVNVHNTDPTRLDLTIPGEAHFYVKATNAQERQQWLVALGSSKACLTNGKPSSTSSMPEELPGEELKSKKSELRLYCDLLMQQVHSVKSAVQTSETPDIDKLNEATSLLSATCDTFIHTLEDCLELSQSSINSKTEDKNSIPSPSRKSSTSSSKSVPWTPISRSTSVDRPQSAVKRTPNSRHTSESSQTSPGTSLSRLSENGTIQEDSSASSRTFCKMQTFISAMPSNFSHVKLLENDGIPTLEFLDACRAILPIFNKLSQTAFTPIRLDVTGNIRKIHQKFNSNPADFCTLQAIVMYEIKANQSHLSNSATVAILWLKRALDFIREFIREYLVDSSDISSIVSNAYIKTLKDFHGWVIRGVFAVAVKSLPTPEEFLDVLAEDGTNSTHADFHPSVLQDMEQYLGPLELITRTLHEYYTQQELDSREQV